MTDQTTSSPFIEAARTLAPLLQERARQHDVEGRFVSDNYRELKQRKLFSAGVPSEFGGGGARHSELCDMLRILAQGCASTALALSMHTHLVAAAVFRQRHGQPAEALLRKVAASELVLVSTGAGDWIDSVGRAERVPGGYRVNAVKRFASGVPAGDLAITSAPFPGAEGASEVLHFAVPLRSEGVVIHNDWDTLGMRGTGSHSLELRDVFIAEDAVTLRRPQGKWHPSWNVVVTVAAPIYMSPYLGIAERAAQLAREAAASRPQDALLYQSLGEIESQLGIAQLGQRDLIANANEYDFAPVNEKANRALIAKTLIAKAARATVQAAVDFVGGSAFYRSSELERLWRDVQGASFHPLPEHKQQTFAGRMALGLIPIG